MKIKVIKRSDDDIFIFEEKDGFKPEIVGRCSSVEGLVETIGGLCGIDIQCLAYFGDYIYKSYARKDQE